MIMMSEAKLRLHIVYDNTVNNIGTSRNYKYLDFPVNRIGTDTVLSALRDFTVLLPEEFT